MKRWICALVAGTIVLGLVCAGCGQLAAKQPEASKPAEAPKPAEPPKRETIKVGVLQPLTGNVAYWGENALLGAKMAADELNAKGGIKGAPIEIISVDTAGDKAQAVNGMKKLLSDKITVVIGPVTSGETFAVGPVSNEAKVCYISPGATADGVGKIGPFVFRNTLNDSAGAPLTAKYMVEKKGVKKAALLYSNNNDYSVGLMKIWEAALNELKVQVVAKVSYSDSDTDFSAQVTKLKQSKPDAIFFSGVAAEGGLLIRQAKQQGLTCPFVSGDGLADEMLFKLAGAASDGVILYTGYSPENPADYAQKFVNDFKAKHGKEPQINNAQAYDAMKILAMAIEKAGAGSPDGIRKAITETKRFPGVSGVTTFNDKNGDAIKPAFLQEAKGGKFQLITVLEANE